MNDKIGSLRVYNCNMELTLDIIGGKWKPLIIYHIGHNESIRYGSLKRLIPDISERVLSRELKSLDSNGLVDRVVIEDKNLHTEYSLSEIGLKVLPVLDSLTEWGNEYNAKFAYAKVLCEGD